MSHSSHAKKGNTRGRQGAATGAGAPKSTRYTMYVVLGVAFVALIVVGLLFYRSGEATEEANAKADQLTTELTAAGLQAPSSEVIVQVLGNDGGAVCANPNAALNRAASGALLANGAAGPGIRPVIADSRFVQATVTVIKVYCPGYLEEFQEYADSLKTADHTE